VDKSILGVRRDGRTTRYVWLDTLRDYGRRLLAERDDEPAELRRRHRDWYLSLARTASRETVGSARRMRVMTILAREPANVRAALEYCFTEPGQTRAGLDLASAWLVWLSGALLREGRYWLERALVADTEPSADRARALWTCGWVAIEQGELGAAEHLLAQAHALAVELGDETALAWSVALTGYAALFAGDLPRARPLLEDGLARHRALGDPYGVIATLSGLSQTTSYLGDPVSEALCEEHLALGERHQLPSATSGLRNLGLELVRQGRTERGTEALREGLRLSRRTGRRMGIAGCVDILAWAEVEAGRHERAARLFGATDTAYRRIGGATPQPQRDRSRHYAALAREALGEPVFTTAFRAGQEMSEDETLDYALAQPRAAPAPAGHPSPLSDRERQIAALVARGLSDKRIAAELVISPRTAQAHVARILAKLGFANRAQIAAWHIGNSGAETLPH
jgi:DNA-binding CsgD family transcriptional regulator/tetratricopeptide (TPR) repeat protein